MLYIHVTAPRIWSNALTLSISPVLSLVMFMTEFIVMLYVSHRLSTQSNHNLVGITKFPGRLVTGVINFLCPCTPVSNLGFINLFSTILIILKVILLYPITIFDLLPVNDNLNRFRCIPIDNATITGNTTDFRICRNNETPNELLFQIVLPLTITSLLFFSIPFGFLISKLMTQPRLTALNEGITAKLESFQNILSNLCDSLMCCCKKYKESDIEAPTETQYPKIENQQGVVDDPVADDVSNDVSDDVKEGLVNENLVRQVEDLVRQRTIKENLMSFVMNIRAVFDELLDQDTGK